MTLHKPLQGILLMLIAMAALASKDGLAKSFIDEMGPFQIIWIQFTGTFIIMGLICLPKYGWKVFNPKPVGGQFIRGALNAVAIAALYWALRYIPLADATAMFMFAPAIVTVLSPVFLNERIGRYRTLAVAFGFCGVLVILKPGFGGDPLGYYIGLASGVLMGLYFIANRRLAGAQPPLLNITHNGLMGAIALTPFLPLFWEPVSASIHTELVVLVLLAIVGQGLMISSFIFAPAVVIAPYSYALLVFAALIGYFSFGTVPDPLTWVGIAMIVGSGLTIAFRERKLSGQ